MRRRSTMLLLILTLATCCFYNWATGQEPARPSPPADGPLPAGPKEFSAMVVFVGGKSIGVVDQQMVDWLFSSDDFATIKGPDDYGVECRLLSAESDKSIIGILTVHYTGKVDPNECVTVAQKHLQNALSKIHQVNMEAPRRELQQADKRRARAEAEVEAATLDVQRLREKGQELLRQLGTIPGAFSGAPDQLLAKLKEDWLSLRVELAGLKARHVSIMEHIEERHVTLQSAEMQQHEFLSELVKIVKIREEQVAIVRALVERAVNPPTNLNEVEVQLATARADLARHRQVIAQKAGSQLLGGLNQQLADVQIEMAAAEARLKAVERALQDLGGKQVQELAINYDRARRRLDSALVEEQAAAAELAQLRRSLQAMQEPRVVIISQEKPSK